MLIGQRFDVSPQKIFNLEDYPKLFKEDYSIVISNIFCLNLLLNFIKDLKEEIISIDYLNLNCFLIHNFKRILANICTEEEQLNLEKHSYMVELCLKYYEELKQEFKIGKFHGVRIRYV